MNRSTNGVTGRRSPAARDQQPLGGHPQRGLVARYRFFEVVNLA
jgi:hypothetical protein